MNWKLGFTHLRRKFQMATNFKSLSYHPNAAWISSPRPCLIQAFWPRAQFFECAGAFALELSWNRVMSTNCGLTWNPLRMNKAFTRESDDAPPAPPEERLVSTAINFVTPRGARLIQEQIGAIERKLASEVAPVIKTELRRDLRYWLARQSSMQVVAHSKYTNTVGFGRRVTIRRGDSKLTVIIVGEDESDPKAGLIAWTAPLARAIEGAKVGEEVDLESGSGRNSHHSCNIRRRDHTIICNNGRTTSCRMELSPFSILE